jgi:Xaa-Pro aminopeptidase
MAALVTGDDTWLVCPASDTAAACDAGIPGDRVVPYGRFYFAGDGPAAAMSDRHDGFGPALAEGLSALGNGRRAGVEGPASAAVDAALGGGSTVDATAWMAAVRRVKLPAEQALLRRAANLAEAGIEAGLAAAGAGVTEREIAARVAAEMAAGGGEPRFVVVTSGPRSALSDAFASERACRPGDLLRFDIGCVYAGYWSDIARTAVIGEPTARQRAFYGALLAGVEAEFTAAKPGTTAGRVFEAAVATVEGQGIRPYRRHHAGHAIGLSVYEAPIVGAAVDLALEPGMVFSLETPYYELGWGGMMVEDTGVVTADGFELFTGIDRSLRVVPA